MSLSESGLSASDVLALTNGNNDGFGGGFGGGWWLILFILLLTGGFGRGWGYGGGNGDSGSGMASMAVPYMLGNSYNADVQRGFDQSAVITALGNLSTAISSGFANQSVDACNKAMTMMQGMNDIQAQMANDRFNTITTLNGGHNAILQQMSTYEMARQQCCCDNKAAIADLKYTVATENCADRTALDNAVWTIGQKIDAGFNSMMEQRYQDKIDAKNEQIANLQRQLSAQELAASQANQTQQLYANNQAQTDRIMDFINPGYARPFYGNGFGNWGGCGCQTCAS
jgi:hypothetical protein